MVNKNVISLAERKAADKKEAARKELPFNCVALLLQGGGALGAYQAGVYQALSEAGIEPDWVAGISIGAINAAIIAGNSPEMRVPRLREFWETVTIERNYPSIMKMMFAHPAGERRTENRMSGWQTVMDGVEGFFKPRIPNPWFAKKGTLAATSFYDTSELRTTLKRLIDFDRINNDGMRLNVGAVHINSGNFVNFDNKTDKIGVEHIMASGALPPGLPPAKIDGEYFWDGGLISNTPLQWVVENKSYEDTLVFQVDLWSATGEFPKTMPEVMTRQKEIQYSSRTRANTDRFIEQHELRHTIDRLLKKLPKELQNTKEAELLRKEADNKVYNIVHLIYRHRTFEGFSKDYDFSRQSMQFHWQAGYEDTLKTLKNPHVMQRPKNALGIEVFDMCKEETPTEIAKKAVSHN